MRNTASVLLWNALPWTTVMAVTFYVSTAFDEVLCQTNRQWRDIFWPPNCGVNLCRISVGFASSYSGNLGIELRVIRGCIPRSHLSWVVRVGAPGDENWSFCPLLRISLARLEMTATPTKIRLSVQQLSLIFDPCLYFIHSYNGRFHIDPRTQVPWEFLLPFKIINVKFLYE